MPSNLIPDSAIIDTAGDISENGKSCWLLRASLPSVNDSSLSAVIWVDKYDWIISKISSSTGTGANTEIRFYYNDKSKFPIPDSTIIEFKLSKGLPGASRPDVQNPFGKLDFQDSYNTGNLEGTVKIYFDKLKVNQGLPDDIFIEDN